MAEGGDTAQFEQNLVKLSNISLNEKNKSSDKKIPGTSNGSPQVNSGDFSILDGNSKPVKNKKTNSRKKKEGLHKETINCLSRSEPIKKASDTKLEDSKQNQMIEKVQPQNIPPKKTNIQKEKKVPTQGTPHSLSNISLNGKNKSSNQTISGISNGSAQANTEDSAALLEYYKAVKKRLRDRKRRAKSKQKEELPQEALYSLSSNEPIEKAKVPQIKQNVKQMTRNPPQNIPPNQTSIKEKKAKPYQELVKEANNTKVDAIQQNLKHFENNPPKKNPPKQTSIEVKKGSLQETHNTLLTKESFKNANNTKVERVKQNEKKTALTPPKQSSIDLPKNWREHRPNTAPQLSSKVFTRGGFSKNEGTPQNFQMPSTSREAVLREKSLSVDSKRPSLSETVGNNAKGQSNDLPKPKPPQQKKRTPKKKMEAKAIPKVETNGEQAFLVGEIAAVLIPKHLLGPNISTAQPVAPVDVSVDSTVVSAAQTQESVKEADESSLKDTENHQEELTIGQDGEEMVRVTVLPIPLEPSKRAKKKLERKRDAQKVEEGKAVDDEQDGANVERDSSSNDSSSSSDELSRPRPSNNQPIIFSIRKTELFSFRRRGVQALKHISPKFPRAIFICRLCSFHISSIPEVHRHMKDERHIRLQHQDLSRQTAKVMPNPSPVIVDAVEQFIQDIYLCSGLSKEDLELRRSAIELLKKAVEVAFPGFSIRPYGSYITELGLKASNVNIGIIDVSPEVKKDGLIIIRVLSWLQGPASTTFRYISDDINCRTPVIHFLHEITGVAFALVVDSDNAYKTSVLLQQYRLIDPRFAVLTVAFRTFARICRLDQPDLGSLPAHAFTLMVLYFMQHSRVLPVLHELKKGAAEDEYLSAAEYFELRDRGEWIPHQMSLGLLWLRLLKFYAYSCLYHEHAVCVRSMEPLLRSTKNWGTRRIAIEDPFHTNANIGAFMQNNQTFEFFIDCMRNLFHYFWVPQTAEGPLFTQLLLPGEGTSEDPMLCTPAEALKRMNAMKKEDVKWDFQPEKILRSKRLPVVCTVCSSDEHTKVSCTELEVPDVGFIPPPDFEYFALLNNVCWNIFRNFSQRDIDTIKRQAIRDELENYIRKEYRDAVLTMFGSSCNGFGFADSDLDLCLTFESSKDGQGLDFASIVKKLGKILQKTRFFCDVVAVHSAKVPIVKLRHRPTGLEADISVYNQLGRRNSHLLATYSAIDSRVRVLGYMAKLLAKQCEIGDASRGSLSSYGYTLMVIYYLQQVKPPVLPVLQEINIKGVDRQKYNVEGWDTWFFDNIQELARVWPHHGANRETPATLWLGFLLFYAKVFDFRLQVVCIRQLNPVYRLEKKWTERPIAIEDPFDLSHNLGSGVSNRMGTYIRRVFVTARKFFQTPVKTLPPKFTSLEEYLFNPDVLVACGPPPNDRGCLICRKIGHKVRDCPSSRNMRNKARNVSKQQRENPQNGPQQRGPHNRNIPQAFNRDKPVQQQQQQQPRQQNQQQQQPRQQNQQHQQRHYYQQDQQMDRNRPEGQLMHRDRPIVQRQAPQ